VSALSDADPRFTIFVRRIEVNTTGLALLAGGW